MWELEKIAKVSPQENSYFILAFEAFSKLHFFLILAHCGLSFFNIYLILSSSNAFGGSPLFGMTFLSSVKSVSKLVVLNYIHR